MKNNYKLLRENCARIIETNLNGREFLSIKSFKDFDKEIRKQRDLRFYKYLRPDYYAIRNFETNQLMCSNPKKFNDIFEGMVNSDDLKPEDTKPIIEKACNAVSISCFSERWDNLLMYAHYTNSFKGFCLEYDFGLIVDSILSQMYFFPVIYHAQPCTLARMNELSGDIDHIMSKMESGSIITEKVDDLISYFIHKVSIWEYEKEWRFIIPISQYWNFFKNKDVHADYHFIQGFDCVSAVYLSPNIDRVIKEHLCDIVKRKNKVRVAEHKAPIDVFQTSMKRTSYKLEGNRIELD